MVKYSSIKERVSGNNKLSIYDADLISKYIISLYEMNIVVDEDKINSLVDKIINQLEGVVYYDNNDAETLDKLGIGKDNKGLSKDNVIYVNKNMPEELKQITLFHELTHFLQRYYSDENDDRIGVMHNWKWRILMEAQTQNLSEMVYSHISGTKKEVRDIKSEDLRMLPGGIIRSNLRNYEMYDSVLRKILVTIGMTMEEFIALNFNNENSPIMFDQILNNTFAEEEIEFICDILDVIYSTDIMIYNWGLPTIADPNIVQSLIDGREINTSSKNQFRYMVGLDRFLFAKSHIFIDKASKLLDLQFSPEKYMPQPEKYDEVMSATMEEVESNPETFIMTECIPACKELWRKNIYTFMVSNYHGESGIWIEIFNELSEENLNYLKSLKSKGIITSIYHNGCYQIAINHIGENASDLLLEVCRGFKMQDVPKNIAYYTEEDFLMMCGCYDEIPNPNYYEMKEFYELDFNSIEEQMDYMSKYDEWEHSINSKQTIRVFNLNKKTKSTLEYAQEHNMIYEDGRVYISQYHYDKHVNYNSYLEDVSEFMYSAHYENGVESVYKQL